MRSDAARRRRENAEASRAGIDKPRAAGADERADAHDDTLRLLLLCCHPALTASSQVALTLRAVGGLTTAQIARVDIPVVVNGGQYQLVLARVW